MPANVETMMYAGETPWHGIGTKVEAELTSGEAIVKAGLDWTVSKRKLAAVGVGEVDGYKALVRDSDNSILSIMGDGYVPLQNKEAFSFFDSVVGGGEAMYHTAGSLNMGRKVWMLAKLPGHIRVEGTDDVSEKFLLLANSHDGSLAVTMRLTSVRVVCQNTLSAALGTEGAEIKLRHTKNVERKYEEARRVLKLASERFTVMNEEVNALAKAKWSEAEMKALVENLFPNGKDGEVSARAVTNRDALMELFESGKGQEMVRGTKWAAMNAVTEFTTWHRGTRVTGGAEANIKNEREARLNSVWFGSGAQMQQKAYNFLTA